MDSIDECSPAVGTNAAAEIKWDSARPTGSSDTRLHQVAHAENGSMSLRGPSLRSRRSQTYVNFRGEAEVWIPTASGEAADHAWSLMRPGRRLIEERWGGFFRL